MFLGRSRIAVGLSCVIQDLRQDSNENLLQSMWYVASPYSHADPAIRQYNHDCAFDTTGILLSLGLYAISPIVHYHPLALRHNLPGDFTYWKRICLSLLSSCDALFILTIAGWEKSKGIQAEVNYADRHGIPCYLLEV